MNRTVAIYARVSTEHEAQLSALENQVQYYDNILDSHPEWTLYKQYIDEGITGTSVRKRKNFMQMLEDAEDGHFDLIITREVSRFARNTVDTLQETRKLKKMGVEVWFTEDNIWTMNDEDGELRLTIMATLAQNESKKTSLRVKAGQMVSFQNGVAYGNGNILGYDRVGKEYIINKEQAETVRMIFDLCKSGYGEKKITYELEKQGRLTSTGKTHWYCSYIGRVLNNPFYCGIIKYRKQFVPDYLEQKKINNHGEVDFVIVEGKHEPIVSRELYYEVQKILDTRRSAMLHDSTRKKGHKTSADIWCQKLVCQCGCKFNRKVWHTTKDGTQQFSYQCYRSVRHGSMSTRKNKGLSIEDACEIPMIPEWKLKSMARLVMNKIFTDKGRVLIIANDLLDRNIINEMNISKASEIKMYEDKISREKVKIDRLLELRIEGEIDQQLFADKKRKIQDEIQKNQDKINALNEQGELSEEELNHKLQVLKYAMEQEFSFDQNVIPSSIIEALVEKIVVRKDCFEWHLKFNKDNINCLVKGTKRKSTVSIIEDSYDDETHHRLQSHRNRIKG